MPELLALIPVAAEGAGAAAVGTAAADAAVASGLAGAAEFGGAAAGLATAGETAAGFSLPSLSTIGQIAGVGGTLLSAKSQIDQAKYAQKLGEVQQQALEQQANEDAAAAERRQIAADRETQLALSRVNALVGAQGGSVSDPGVVDLEGNIAQQGQYNALSALYSGQARARADRYQGGLDLFAGNRAAQAGPLNAFGTVLSGLSSFATNRALLRYYSKIGQAPYGAV